MRPALDDADQDFLRLLNTKGDAKIDDLCDDTGVTATAIRQRLGRMLDLGLVARVTVRAGRGRPFHRYALTASGRRALGDNYAELAILLWESIQQIDDPAMRQQIQGRVRDQFVSRLGFAGSDRSLDEKLEHLRKNLDERGFQAELSRGADGVSVLRENHCPYYDLAEKDRQVCELEKEVFEQVLGVRLKVVQNCCDGGNCCEFRPVEEPDTPAGCHGNEI